MVDEGLFEIMACPQCRGDLEYNKEENTLICHNCRLIFRIEDDIPIMLIDEAQKF